MSSNLKRPRTTLHEVFEAAGYQYSPLIAATKRRLELEKDLEGWKEYAKRGTHHPDFVYSDRPVHATLQAVKDAEEALLAIDMELVKYEISKPRAPQEIHGAGGGPVVLSWQDDD